MVVSLTLGSRVIKKKKRVVGSAWALSEGAHAGGADVARDVGGRARHHQLLVLDRSKRDRRVPCRERVIYWQPTGPNPLYHCDD